MLCCVFILLLLPSLLFVGHKLALTLQSTKVYNQENKRNNFISIVMDPGTSLEPEIRGLKMCLFPFTSKC